MNFKEHFVGNRIETSRKTLLLQTFLTASHDVAAL